jgi:hypothetical protein
MQVAERVCSLALEKLSRELSLGQKLTVYFYFVAHLVRLRCCPRSKMGKIFWQVFSASTVRHRYPLKLSSRVTRSGWFVLFPTFTALERLRSPNRSHLVATA